MAHLTRYLRGLIDTPATVPADGEAPVWDDATEAFLWGATAGGGGGDGGGFAPAKGCVMVLSANITGFPSAVQTRIDLDAVELDTDDMADTANHQIVIPRDGLWLVSGGVAYNGAATGQFLLAAADVNGPSRTRQVDRPSSTSNEALSTGTKVLSLQQGDTVELSFRAAENTSGSLTVRSGNSETFLSVAYLDTGGAGSYTEVVGDGTATSFDVVHNLGSRGIVVSAWDTEHVDGDEYVDVGWLILDDDTVRVVFADPPNADAVRVVVATGGGAAGGLTLIDEVVLGADGTIEFSSIPSTFKSLYIEAGVRSTQATGGRDLVMRVGNGTVDAGASAYFYYTMNSSLADTNSGGSDVLSCGRINSEEAAADELSPATIKILDYARTGEARITESRSTVRISGVEHGVSVNNGGWTNTADVIDIIELASTLGFNPLTAGSWARLYGRG